MTPRVSIILSCLNSQTWLAEAVNSVLSQSERNFEFIIIDDGSTDGSRTLIEQFALADSRILPLFKAHSGLADSLNQGLQMARAPWIARLDADDLCAPDRLTRQLESVRQSDDVVLCGTGFVTIDAAGMMRRVHRYPKGHAALLRRLRGVRPFFPHSSALFARQAALELGGYNPFFVKSQDWDFWLRLSQHGRVCCLAKPLVRIRRHDAQVSTRDSGVPQLAYGLAATICYELRQSNHTDPSIAELPARQRFLSWVVRRATECGLFASRDAWHRTLTTLGRRTRASLSTLDSPPNDTSAATLLFRHLRWRVLGNPLPRQLAQEWRRQETLS
jgi:GT2 family glycosyltransferase